MSRFVLEKPWIHDKKWLVFPNSVLTNLGLADCNDTISGVCYQGKTLDECIKTCGDNTYKGCSAGYYITGADQSICVPLNTSVHTFLNPVNMLRKKDIYPSMKNLNVSTFINKTRFNFPPDIANAVFFEDFFALENVKTGLTINLPPNDKLDTTTIMFNSQEGMNLQLLPYRETMQRDQVYIPVLYGRPLIVNIPGTNLVMVKSNNHNIGWASRILASPDIQNTFKIFPIDPKKTGKEACFGDIFYITYQDIYIIEYNSETNSLNAIYEGYEMALQKGRNIQFRFLPKMNVYYCNGSKCEPIPLEKTERNGVQARYNGAMVLRNPGCWGLCNSFVTGTDKLSWDDSPPGHGNSTWKLVLVILLILVIITLVVMKYIL